MQRSPHRQSIDGEERCRNGLDNSNNHGPCVEVETGEGRVNGSVMASGCPTTSDNQQDEDQQDDDQQDDDIVDI